MYSKKCPKCNKEITANNFKKHISSCNPDKKTISIDPKWMVGENQYECPICKKIYPKKGISSHIWRAHGEGKELKTKSPFYKGYTPWNKGLNKKDPRVLNNANSLKTAISKNPEKNGFYKKRHTEKTKKIIGEKLSKNNNGGRCKWFEVERSDGKRFRVQGTWERDFIPVLNILDNDWIKIGNNTKEHTFKWKDDYEKIHYYTPDFWCPNLGKYFEIKGYWWGNDKRKMELVLEQNNIPLEIIRKKELEIYLKLVKI